MSWYLSAPGGNPQGPFDVNQIAAQVTQSGDPSLMVCQAGSSEWVPLASVPELAHLAAPPKGPPAQQRKVGILLAVGIVFVPIIFSWFTLRKGHSNLSRGVALGWLALVVVLYGAGQSGRSSSAASAAGQAPPEPEVTVTAMKLAKAYDANEARANMQYKGKTLQVTGAVKSIETGMLDEPYLTLRGTNMFMGPQAHGLPKEVAASISKGQEVTLICNGRGEVAGTPMLKECHLVEK